MEVSVITTDGIEIVGEVLGISASTLTLSVDGTPRGFQEGGVLRVTRMPQGMSRLVGGLIGAGLGFAGALGIASACTVANETGSGCSNLGGAAAGVFFGSAAAGALLAGRTDDQLIFRSPDALSQPPSTAP